MTSRYERISRAHQELISLNFALDEIYRLDPLDEELEEYARRLEGKRDQAREKVRRLLPIDAAERLASQSESVDRSEGTPDSHGFRETAMVIGVATVASIAISPFAAFLVHDAVIKELVKTAVSSAFAGVATLAAENYASTVTKPPAPDQPSRSGPITPLPANPQRKSEPPKHVLPQTGKHRDRQAPFAPTASSKTAVPGRTTANPPGARQTPSVPPTPKRRGSDPGNAKSF
jgi:hypothetical protein